MPWAWCAVTAGRTFCTITCNPEWPEIKRELLPHQIATDRPDIVCRVFHLKLTQIMDDVTKLGVCGAVQVGNRCARRCDVWYLNHFEQRKFAFLSSPSALLVSASSPSRSVLGFQQRMALFHLLCVQAYNGVIEYKKRS